MKTMKALTFADRDPDHLMLEELPVPQPGPTEVFVGTTAVGVNPVDWKTRRGGGVRGF